MVAAQIFPIPTEHDMFQDMEGHRSVRDIGTAGKAQLYPCPDPSYWVIKTFLHFLQMVEFFSPPVMLIQNSLRTAAGFDIPKSLAHNKMCSRYDLLYLIQTSDGYTKTR